MKTFNIELWEEIKRQNFLKGRVYFGVAPEKIPAPYCVMHILDTGKDIFMQTLCSKDLDANSVKVSNLQFNVYASNNMQLEELLEELNNLINNLSLLPNFRIIQALRQRTKTASSFSNEVGQGFTEFDFKFELL